MSRGVLTATNNAQAEATTLRAEYLADVAFPSGTIYMTTGSRPLSYNGNQYLSDGRLRSFSGISETIDLKAHRISISVSGVDADLLSKVMTDNWHFVEVNLFIGLFDENWALVDDPVPLAPTLSLSQCVVRLGDEQGEIEISSETLDILNMRNSAVLATSTSQKRRYPGDTGLDDLTAIGQREIRWGGKVSKPPTSGSSTAGQASAGTLREGPVEQRRPK